MNFVDSVSHAQSMRGEKGIVIFIYDKGYLYYWKNYVVDTTLVSSADLFIIYDFFFWNNIQSAPTADGSVYLTTGNGDDSRWTRHGTVTESDLDYGYYFLFMGA